MLTSIIDFQTLLQSDLSSFHQPILLILSDMPELEALKEISAIHRLQMIDTTNSQIREFEKDASLSGASHLVRDLHTGISSTGSLPYSGIWVYYPWRNSLTRIISEEVFIRLRTQRNRYKISSEEQDKLSGKRIGVVGLSVGHSAALNIAIERLCGELRLADFDQLELGNLNRIRASLVDVGLNKAIITARHIAELDPFIETKLYKEGLTDENIEDFLLGGGKLDLVVEECDDVYMKVRIRQECKKYGIPVVMEMSDRGMIDIERYDLDPKYPIFHGLIDESSDIQKLKELRTSEEKLPYLLPIVGADTLSSRMKASAIELNSTISSWPQLGADVAYGGAFIAVAARGILLNADIQSGRRWIDVEAQFDSVPVADQRINSSGEVKNESFDERQIHSSVPFEALDRIMSSAVLATSPGNKQNWLFELKDDSITVTLGKELFEFSDNLSWGSLIGIGACVANIQYTALNNGYHCERSFVESSGSIEPLVRMRLSKCEPIRAELLDYINVRTTFRKKVEYSAISVDRLDKLRGIVENYGATLVESREVIREIGEHVSEGDLIRICNQMGHMELFGRELKFSEEEAVQAGIGLNVADLELSQLDLIGLNYARDFEIVNYLNEIGGGKNFKRISRSAFEGAGAIAIFCVDNYSPKSLIEIGIEIQAFWLECTKLGIGCFPITVLQALFTHLESHDDRVVSKQEVEKIRDLHQSFHSLLRIPLNRKSVFLFRLTNETSLQVKKIRRPWRECLLTH